ncbi:SPRY-domain-containing protein [Lichtheimia hyalospora FSU 10163]|nr:SPRY-domain-containing protein [Lichtheimia hyalospora FSU 10163]
MSFRRQSHVPLSPLQKVNSAKRRCTSTTTTATSLYTSATPRFPSYLEHTLYADLVREQHRNRQARSGEGSGSNSLDNLDLRLPSQWNVHDKSRHLEIDPTGLELIYTGPGKTESHAASVRANFPIRRQCGIYYFEMKVLSKGEDGFIGIGFCSGKNGLDRLPGWDNDSWGYHGDDGHSFQECGTGDKYGPQFTTGDVVGCGVDLIHKTAFYTKNGTFLGPAFKTIKTHMDLFPCVGLRTVGERVTVNFGQNPFVFDIVQYIKEQKLNIMKQVTTRPYTAGNSTMDQLVLSYLVYQGYMKTAQAAIKNIEHVTSRSLRLSHAGSEPNDREEKDMYARQSIRTAVLAGNVDRALELVQEHFSHNLEEMTDGQNILFELKCRKLVEMMREYSKRHARREKMPQKTNGHMKSKTTMQKHGDTSQPGEDMDIDSNGYDSSTSKRVRATSSGTNTNGGANGFMDSGLVLSDDEASETMLEDIMAYGKALQNEYQSDQRPEIRQRLKEVFSLFAYSDPTTSPMAYLMDDSGRQELANRLNAAMLVLQERPSQPPLERIYQQAMTSNQQLACLGYPESMLLDVDTTLR